MHKDVIIQSLIGPIIIGLFTFMVILLIKELIIVPNHSQKRLLLKFIRYFSYYLLFLVHFPHGLLLKVFTMD